MNRLTRPVHLRHVLLDSRGRRRSRRSEDERLLAAAGRSPGLSAVARDRAHNARARHRAALGAGHVRSAGAALATIRRAEPNRRRVSTRRVGSARGNAGAARSQILPASKNAMMNANSTSDSISARPRIIGVWMRGRSAGVAADAFERGRSGTTLTETTTEHRQADRDGRADRGSGARATISSRRASSESRGCGEGGETQHWQA